MVNKIQSDLELPLEPVKRLTSECKLTMWIQNPQIHVILNEHFVCHEGETSLPPCGQTRNYNTVYT